MRSYLDFEKPVAELEAKIEELRALNSDGDAIADEISRIEGKAAQALKELYAGLTPWQKTQVARHPQRPHCLDYVATLIEDFVPLAGDRKHGEDEAIVGGFGRFRGDSVCIIGHEKGSDTDSRLKHNFGMARPEGYRKAARLMGMADHFDVPVIAAIIGEGGSGGAIAIATANRVIMLEHAIYSVISPEGAASILWRDTAKAQDAASSMKITAHDMVRFGIVDAVVPEPTGGAHRDPAATIAATGDAIARALGDLRGLDRPTITRLRREKFLAIGRTIG
jgi:acetyl-CoA carboxylase carboxyl transferase subunit alpha